MCTGTLQYEALSDRTFLHNNNVLHSPWNTPIFGMEQQMVCHTPHQYMWYLVLPEHTSIGSGVICSTGLGHTMVQGKRER